MIDENTKICGIIGDPVKHSLSPVMHNAGYKELGLNYHYLPFEVEAPALHGAIDGMRAMGICGFSVTIPHKIEVMKYLDEVDEVAQAIGAVNTVVNENGILKGYNTDWVGAVRALEDVCDLKEKSVIVLGAGGAARAIVYGMKKAECGELVILNRTAERAKELADEVGADFGGGLEEKGFWGGADVVINTTSVGMEPDVDSSPVGEEVLREGMVLLDIVYKPLETKFLKMGKEAGARVVTGEKMLLYQAVEQFRLFTGEEAPVEVMSRILLDSLSV